MRRLWRAPRVLSQSTNTAAATLAAGSLFTSNLASIPSCSSGELWLEVDDGVFEPPSTRSVRHGRPPLFVRTSITGFTTQMSLIAVLGHQFHERRRAVQSQVQVRPLTTACNIVPVFVCADTTQGTAPLFNYQVGQVLGLNLSSGTASTIGPGNYGLLRLGGPGGNSREKQSCRRLRQLRLRRRYAVRRSRRALPGRSRTASILDLTTTRAACQPSPISAGPDLQRQRWPSDVANVAWNTGVTCRAATTFDYDGEQADALTFNYANYTSLAPTSYDTDSTAGGASASRPRGAARRLYRR